MTLVEVLDTLFPAGHDTRVENEGILHGTARYGEGRTAAVLGLVGRTPLGVDGALALAGRVLDVIHGAPGRPVAVLIDAQSQRMRRRDEMLGLNEYLAHLAKCFVLASQRGHRTVSVLFGRAAAGAFIATGLVQDELVAVPGGDPVVMDLPSIARVTKLPQDRLEALSKDTPVFAPGLDHAPPIGAVAEIWTDGGGWAQKMAMALDGPPGAPDRRDEIGAERKGRLKAAAIARRVKQEAVASIQRRP
ncbi:MAG: biotin-independent malonate decarboxylase subunit gamma [Verrucomicrobia bacterium]|nr:biotin-independent malonate decarboxylase subunit gamma [Verrucomicrobiota bacterium]